MTSDSGASVRIAAAFSGGGEIGALIRSRDWSSTGLGPIERWPDSLITSASICIHSRYPIVILWGPELLNIYNDAFVPILGAKHPRALGSPAREVWAEIWDVIHPMLEGVLSGGEPTWSEDLMLSLDRHGFTEECYFTFSFAPIVRHERQAYGVFTALSETTAHVVGERRLALLHELAADTMGATSEDDACSRAARVLEGHRIDAPFAVFYLLEEGRRRARLVATSGLPERSAAAVPVIDLDASVQPWPLGAARGGRVIDDVADRFGGLDASPWPERAGRAAILPLARALEGGPLGYLVLGLSPRLAFDARYARFVDLVAEHASAAVESARAYREENRRAETLAEIDRAKDNFLAVLGHELRNPLAPIVMALQLMTARGDPSTLRERAVIERQVRHLMRLVEDLLDVSRIARGKMDLRLEPVELADVVARAIETARPLVEQRRHVLAVDVPRTGLTVGADATRLAQAVMNLVANAAKYTEPGGRIEVSARAEGGSVTLGVRDTGIGISHEMLPRIFDVFTQDLQVMHRAHGGLGLGLSIVRSLVELHGGTVEARSEGIGKGSEFLLKLPALGGPSAPQSSPDRRGTPRPE